MRGGLFMDINLFSKDVDLSDVMRDHLEKQLSKVKKMVNDDKIISYDVRVNKDRAFYKVEVTIHLPGVLIRVEEKGSDFYNVVDGLVDTLERRLRKYKERSKNKHKKPLKDIQNEPTPIFEENESQITKRKRFFLKPMTEEEAVLQMEMLGHSFFVFKNVNTDEINTLYVRKNGTIGLIEIE